MHIVITGANRGIGHEMFQAYTKRGETLTATSRNAAAPFVPLDVTDPASLAAFQSELGDQPIDLLVCNAGVYLDKPEKLDDGYAAPLWADSFATNVAGVFHTVQAALPGLRRAKNAKIVIISSQMGSDTRAPGGSYIYRASKAAALNLGRNLATDLKPEGIAVGIYHPGWASTDMGGAAAEITPVEAATGLIQRFDVLSIETTGCFETWDGRPHAY